MLRPSYLIDALEADPYSVSVAVIDWVTNPATASPMQVQVEAGETKRISFTMAYQPPGPASTAPGDADN